MKTVYFKFTNFYEYLQFSILFKSQYVYNLQIHFHKGLYFHVNCSLFRLVFIGGYNF